VPQVYLGPAPTVPTGVQQADRALVGFDRVELEPGQGVRRTVHIGPGEDVDGHGNRRGFQYWSTAQQTWVTAPGPRSVWVGLADSDALLKRASSSATAQACTAAARLRRVSASPRRGRLAIRFSRPRGSRVDIDVFQSSVRRQVIGQRLVARFRGRTRGFTWNGRANRRGRRVTDGYYFVRFRARVPGGQSETRRVALRLLHGRFLRRPGFYGRTSCSTLTSFKLTWPVFGGVHNRALGIAYRVGVPATIRVTVTHRGRVVRRWSARSSRAHRTYRLRLASEHLPRGDYRVRLVAAAGTSKVTSTLTSRRL
jgi:hypothetical protein